VLDARRCISYLTIELKGSIPEDLRPRMGNWVYGCDVCQTVCPFTRFVTPTAEPAFWPVDADRAAPPLADLLALDDAAFRARFSGSAILRITRERLVRNACVAAGNSGLPEFIPLLDHLARSDGSPLVREHAAWALARL
jgi:epoxyqueuosine reductase